MCRARSGPRCSSEGAKRYDRALLHFQRIQELYDAEKAAHKDGKVSRRRALQYENAHRRLDAAKRVYYSTAEGQKSLHKQKKVLEASLAFVAESDEPNSKAYRDRLKITRKMEALEDARKDGVQRRRLSWKDYHLCSHERRDIRDESRERGGMMAANAHPMSKENVVTPSEGRKSGLSLPEWGPEQVSNAHHWVEAGANPGWSDRATVRPPSKVNGTSVGTERVLPSASRPIRVNTPDGQVVEARTDVHCTKNDEGQYVVSTRYTVASSWEDSAPIDVTSQGLGHILTGEKGVSKRYSTQAETFTNKRSAEKAFRAEKRRLMKDAPGEVAIMARESLTSRLNKDGNASLQQRNIPVWPRYAASQPAA